MKRCFLPILLSIFLILCSGVSFSQQANVWTLGVGARVDFGTTPPTVGTSSISSYEGCASISDNAGNLMFYTDGISVWDNNNVVITSGMMGHWSAAQSGIVVPEPGTTPGTITNRYYIFSIPQLASERARYTIYDATTHSIVTLNATLPDHSTAQNTTESVTVARHCNGIDFWVVTHEMGNNRFKAYQVTNSGVMAPVVSDVGPVTTSGNGNINAACNMKMAPSNKRLAFIVRQTSVSLLNFNPSTGVISNPVSVANGSGQAYYGVEFSPNSNVLYYTNIMTGLFKYDIPSASTLTLSNISASYGNLYAGLQLAPNGCIYMAKDGDSNMGNLNQTSLGRIDNPNNFPGSAYTASGLLLASGTGVKCGLPNIIPAFNLPAFSLSGDDTICNGEYSVLNVTGGTNYSWDPIGTISNGTGSTVTATPSVTTTYTVTSTDSYGCSMSASLTITVNPALTVTASNNGPLCEGLTLNLTATGQTGATYSWTGPNGFTSTLQNPQLNTITSANAGTYTVTIALNGCSATASTTFAVTSVANVTINPGGPYCENASPVTLSAAPTGGTWSGTGITNAVTGEFDPSLASTGNNTIIYSVTGSCGGSTTATIGVNPLPVPSGVASTASGCYPLTVQFTNTTNPPGTNVLWDLGNGSFSTSNNAVGTYTSPGCYTVSLTTTDASGCVGTTVYNSFVCVSDVATPAAQFQVDGSSNPMIDSLFYFVNSSVNAVSYEWDFGDNTQSTSENPEHSYTSEGTYIIRLIAINSSGCSDTVYSSIHILENFIFYVPNAFTPNGDQNNDVFRPVLTAGIASDNFSFLIFDRWGELVFETTEIEAGWNGTYLNKIVQDGIYVWKLQFKRESSDKMFEFNGHVSVLK